MAMSIREKIGDFISDKEVDPALADLLPTIPDGLFLEEDIEYEPFDEEDAALCRKLMTILPMQMTST
jgi:hypothetical protein